jgi:hypothetical protein
MRKTQERKGFRLPFSTLLPILGGEPSKFDQSCFLRMEFQTELGQSFPKCCQFSQRARVLRLRRTNCSLAIAQQFKIPHFSGQYRDIVAIYTIYGPFDNHASYLFTFIVQYDIFSK